MEPSDEWQFIVVREKYTVEQSSVKFETNPETCKSVMNIN